MNNHKNIYISRISKIVAWLGFIWAVGLTIAYSVAIFYSNGSLTISTMYRAFELYSPYPASILFNYIATGSVRLKPWSKQGRV